MRLYLSSYIDAFIELPEGYDVSEIDRSTILLNDTIPVDPFWVEVPIESVIGDYDNDAIPDLMVKFDREAVSDLIISKGVMYGNVTLTLRGQLYSGALFGGSDIIGVRMPGDINIDGKVDMRDLATAASAFGSYPGHLRWNYVADENEDDKIDMRDIALIASNFGKTYA